MSDSIHNDSFSNRFDNSFNHHTGHDVSVDGYVKHDGTFVKPHFRSHANSNPFDNWSFPGNMNPHTGEIASGSQAAYLHNHFMNTDFQSVLSHSNPLDYVNEYVMPPLSFNNN